VNQLPARGGGGAAGPGTVDAAQAVEHEGEIARRLEARHRVLLEAAVDDALDRRRERTLGGARGLRRRVLEDRADRVGRRASGVQRLAFDHLVEHTAEREDVGPMVGGLAAGLLRRHVAERADDRVGQRRLPGLGRRAVAPDRRAGQLREAEVEDLDPFARQDEDVLGLEIAVRDAVVVRHGQALGELAAEVERGGDRQGPAGQPVAQRLPVEQLGDEVLAALVGADVVDRQDRRVVQRRGRARLLLEAADAVRILGERVGEELDRDRAAQTRIDRTVHLAHAAGADDAGDLVRTDAGAARQAHGTSIPPLRTPRRGSPCSRAGSTWSRTG
jgi:hypothetical protein